MRGFMKNQVFINHWSVSVEKQSKNDYTIAVQTNENPVSALRNLGGMRKGY